MLSVACLLGCGEPHIAPLSAVSATLPSDAGVSGPTAREARKQNWDCRRIQGAISNLVEPLQSAKARAQKEEEQMPKTFARLVARLSGPPGAGNAALAEFQQARSDADQLNEMLRKKECPTFPIGVEAPAFLKR